MQWEGAPILVENSLPADPKLLKEIDGWRHEFEEWGQTVLGVATASFDQSSCKQGECSMGNLVADAMLDIARTPIISAHNGDKETEGTRPWTDIAFINSGGVRSGLPAGNITIEMIMTTSPFGNGLIQTQMTGAEIMTMLEAVSAGRYKDSQKQVTSNIQISGLRYIYDSSRPLTETHLIQAEIQGYDGIWTAIKPRRTYGIVTLDFVLTGGDNILEKKPRREIKLELLDKVLMDYIENRAKITPYKDGRIKDVAVKSPEAESLKPRGAHWPIGTPEHLKSQYPGGVQDMLAHYQRLRQAGVGSRRQGPVKTEVSFDESFERDSPEQDVLA